MVQSASLHVMQCIRIGVWQCSPTFQKCLWGHALKKASGINSKSRVLYPDLGYLSSATWPALPKKQYNGLINQSIIFFLAVFSLAGTIGKMKNNLSVFLVLSMLNLDIFNPLYGGHLELTNLLGEKKLGSLKIALTLKIS